MQKRNLTADDLGTLFLWMAIIFGMWFRLYPPLNAGFPIGDGGLFYLMVKALQQNHYRLPEFVQYNGLDIPFAYPPFGFYMAGLLADLFHTDALKALVWLPAIVLMATLPAIYFFALHLLNSRFKAGLAAFFYACLPGSITWLIMGGGITRSFGQLFLILATTNIYLLFTGGQKKHLLFYAILFSTLVCLSHPEATIHTLTYALILWIFYGRNKDGIRNTLFVGLGTLILASPWWITTLLRFGLSPYLSASQTGFSQAVALLAPFTSFSQEPLLPILSVLAIIGIAVSIAKRDYLLPILYVIPFLVESRNATNVYIVPLALLASVAVSDLILPTLSMIEGQLRNREYTMLLQGISEKFLLSYVLVLIILGMQVATARYAGNTVSAEVRTASEWIRLNTPKESKFVVITGKPAQLNDFINEWFPALTGRNSVTTIQGTEWLGSRIFAERRSTIFNLENCSPIPKITECIEKRTHEEALEYDYIVITETDANPSSIRDVALKYDIDPAYKTIYDSPQVLIIEKPRSPLP